MTKTRLLLATFGLITATMAQAGRPILPSDIDLLRTVSDPQVDPSGTWVSYTIEQSDLAADKRVSHIWMTRWDGTRSVQLTGRKGESESTARFSPDGHWMAFLSSRGKKAKEDSRLWIIDRAGGEGMMMPGIEGSVEDLAWAPDSKSLALIVEDPDPDEKANSAKQASASLPDSSPSTSVSGDGPSASDPTDDDGDDDKSKPPKPIVINRFQFKQDMKGYLRTQRKRLWLYDIASHRTRRMTTGDYDEALPAWAPDGRSIAFTSKRVVDPDRTYDSNLFVVRVGSAPAEPRALTTFAGADNDAELESYPAWSPDGRRIVYLQGGPPKLFSYGVHTLAVVSAAGGAPTVLTPALDRNVSHPVWSHDGRRVRFVVEDDETQWIGEVGSSGGRVKPVANGFRVFDKPAAGSGDNLAVLLSTPAVPGEVYALSPQGNLRQLSHHNDAWLKEVAIAPVQRTVLQSRDGTEVHGFLVMPAANPNGRNLPTVLFNHGGPQAQFNADFDINWQILAAHGFAVVATNPRGSTGRGEAYAKALYADWGGPAVPDALSAVDAAVKQGIADPSHLYVGGWSYGAMLTNYIIASDTRFRGAVSGAGISNVFAGYGTDQYIRDYETELGTPWANVGTWMRNSYPFFNNPKIVTPTLFMVGDKDFNVPLLNSEQMYQALKSRRIDSELVIYPGQNHGLTRPSFLRDRMSRWLAWYDAHR